jgi:hypothetical protein
VSRILHIFFPNLFQNHLYVCSGGPSPLSGKSEIVFRRSLVDNLKSITIQFLIIKYKHFQKLDFGAPCHLALRAAAPLALPQGRHCMYVYRCPKNDAIMVHYGVEEITANVRKMFKTFYWTHLLIWRSLKVTFNTLNRSIILKYIYVLNCHENYLESYILSKYKTTHYQYLILHNREFRSFGNLKKIILNPLRQHCNVMMYIFGYVVFLLIAIIDLSVISP